MAANIALAPELRGTACAFYDSKEALRYSTCTQTLQLQRELTQAAIQLLHLPVSSPTLVLFAISVDGNSTQQGVFWNLTGFSSIPSGPWLWLGAEWCSTVRDGPHLGWV